jgi:hypothetical protein
MTRLAQLAAHAEPPCPHHLGLRIDDELEQGIATLREHYQGNREVVNRLLREGLRAIVRPEVEALKKKRSG